LTYDTRTTSVYFGFTNYRMDLSLTCFEVHSFEQITKHKICYKFITLIKCFWIVFVLSTVYGDVGSRLLENERWAQNVPCQNIEMLPFFQGNFLQSAQATPLYVAKYLPSCVFRHFYTWKQPLQPSCGTSIRNLWVHIDHLIYVHTHQQKLQHCCCVFTSFLLCEVIL